ncbi:MAG: MFS transporter [Acidobacteriota bacterium]
MPPPRPISTPVKWLICGVAALGFLFDIYEILVAPLVVQPALLELGGLKLGTAEYRFWAGLFLYIPPLIGGFCGLWGGYFTDRFGRRRILTWSIWLYTASAVAAGYSTSLPELLTFRTLCYAGVCVEFVAAVAWLAELFEEPKTREAVLGFTQTFSSLGGVLVSGVFFVASRYGSYFPAIHGGTFGMALYADERRGSRDSVDPHSSVSARVAGVGRQEGGGNTEAAEHSGTVQPSLFPRHGSNYVDVRVRVRRGHRDHPTVAADRGWDDGGRIVAGGRTRTGHIVSASVAGVRRADGTTPDGEPRAVYRQPPEIAADVSGAWIDPDAVRVSLHQHTWLGMVSRRDLSGGRDDGRAIELPGQLFTSGVPGVFCAARARALRPTWAGV